MDLYWAYNKTNELLTTETGNVSIYYVLSGGFVVCEILCIVATYKMLQQKDFELQPSVGCLYLALHITLLMRFAYLICSGFGNSWSGWPRFFEVCTLLVRDLLTLLVICRILTAMSDNSPDDPTLPSKLHTIYYGVSGYGGGFLLFFFVTYLYNAFMSIFAMYYLMAELGILGLFGWALLKFYEYSKTIDPKEKQQPLFKSLSWLNYALIIVMCLRLIQNISEFLFLRERIQAWGSLLRQSYHCFVITMIELVPVFLICRYLNHAIVANDSDKPEIASLTNLNAATIPA